MENRAHQGESKEHRLQRLQSSHPVEAIETLLNSIDNFFNNEIRLTPENHQTSLLFMGIHASALTIAEAFVGKGGPEGYAWFLKTFVDGETDDTKFSLIAVSIHDWRNVLAHQWIGSIGHVIGYDYAMSLGWEKRDDILFINPKIYCEKYLQAFAAGGKIWKYDQLFSPEGLEGIKARIVQKYQEK
jgi:hypothetical protein